MSAARHRKGGGGGRSGGPNPSLSAAVSESEMRGLDGGADNNTAGSDGYHSLPVPGRHRRRRPGPVRSFLFSIKSSLSSCLRSACPASATGCCVPPADDEPPRRCWDDWFHNLSYQPTCLLLMGVFAAYFVTIVVFAGLYLTVNEVGKRYAGGGHGTDGLELDMSGGAELAGVDGSGLGLGLTHAESGSVGGTGATSRFLSADTNDAEVPPEFCGMDINNHMEGEFICQGCCRLFEHPPRRDFT